MQKNNKKINAIVRLKNAILTNGKETYKARYVYLIQYTDKTYNIIDLKNKKDITNYDVALNRKRSKLKFLMGGK